MGTIDWIEQSSWTRGESNPGRFISWYSIIFGESYAHPDHSHAKGVLYH